MTYVSDTHALVWLLEDDPQLSPRVAAIFSDPTAQIVISAHALYFRHSGQPQGLPLRRRGDTNLVGAGLVPARFACCNHIAKTLTNLEFAVCKVRPLFALTPSPSPTMWERGAARGHVWSAEAAASAWTEAALPHSIIPLARPAGEGDKGGEGKKARLPAHISAGEKSRLPASSVPNRCTLSDLRGVVFTHILRTLAAQLV